MYLFDLIKRSLGKLGSYLYLIEVCRQNTIGDELFDFN